MKHRLLVVEDHAALRASLCEWLGDVFPAGEIVGVCSGEEAVRQAAVQPPTIALTDLDLSEGGGLEGIQRIKSVAPDTHVVVLALHDDLTHQNAAAAAGASVLVAKHRMGTELVSAIAALRTPAAQGSADSARP